MKEIKFTRCFINGKKSGVAAFDNGANYILYFGSTLGAGDGSIAELQAAGASLHSFKNSLRIASADDAGIKAVIPGAQIDWDGSPAFIARAASAVGTRGGSSASASTSSTAAAATAPAGSGSVPADPAPATAPAVVASADAFKVPAVSEVPALDQILNIMPNLAASVNSYGAAVAEVAINGGDPVGLPADVAGACGFVPALGDAIKVYENVIIRAAEDYKEKKAAELKAAEEKAAALAAAKRAAENGKTLVALSDGSTVEVTGRVHPAFAEVFEDLQDFQKVYLYGPAGTGKSFMSRQLAEALGVPFYMSGKSDLKFDLTGSPDITGKLMETQFYKAFIGGGVWLWDELDRSSADSCTAINEALANGYCDFPGVGLVRAHKDFYVVAAGNTVGRGSGKYAGAQVQDEAVLTRFLSKIEIGYCREMDMIVTDNDNELCDFVAAVRDAIEAAGVNIDLAIRLLKPMQKKAARRGYLRALETGLFAGLEKTQIKLIASRVSGSGAWFDALQELAA